MTDRELLEAAAKAAGIEIKPHVNGRIFKELMFTYDGKNWNPLEDDGDALRLACDLGLNVFPIARTLSGAACSAVGTHSLGRLSEVVDASMNTQEATRRAIVKAAAAIHKG